MKTTTSVLRIAGACGGLVLTLASGDGYDKVEAAEQQMIEKLVGFDSRASDTRSCVGPGPVDIDDFETWIHRSLSANVVGYGLAISVAGIPAAVGQGGFAQIPLLDGNVPFTHQTDIQVASVSKTITAIALLQLMDKLDISPDDPIGPWLPPTWVQGPGFGDGSLTFDDLLTHQTGVDQALAAMINAAAEPLPNPNTWEGLQLLVATGIPSDVAASACPTANDDGTYTLNGPQEPAGDHYGVSCYKNANYALARELIWRLALQTGDLGVVFDVADPKDMPMASATGYQKVVRDHVLTPAGVVGSCKATGSPAQRSLMYDVKGNVPLVMLTAGADAYSNDDSDLLECGPYNWSLSALDLVKIMGKLSCGNLLSDAAKTLMNERKLGWHADSNSALYPNRFWKGGGWTQTRSNVKQALWPLHPDHPANDPAASEDGCAFIGPNLVCPATGPATNRIHSCVVEFPFGIDAALVINSDLRSDADATACTVLLEAFDKSF
jgi:CubicO group peptidase (beta-lactamase class C family)